MNAKAKAPPAPLPALRHSTATPTLPDARAKQILKEAVDAVVNSFAKHTQGYGRGRLQFSFLIDRPFRVRQLFMHHKLWNEI